MTPDGMIRYDPVKAKSAYLAALFAIVTWSVTFGGRVSQMMAVFKEVCIWCAKRSSAELTE